MAIIVNPALASHRLRPALCSKVLASSIIKNAIVIGNQTPIWLAPNGNCQNNLEVGDVIENLPNGVYPVTLHGFTYHPQNVALLQWFAEDIPSNATMGCTAIRTRF